MIQSKDAVATVVAKLVLARHGKATSAQPGQRDATRQLTELGQKQAAALSLELGEGNWFDVVVSSPLDRAMETTKLATLQTVTPVQELGVNDNADDPINIMFGKLGYAPLSAYFQHELSPALKEWARAAIIRVLELAEREAVELGRPVQVFIGGHAVCTNALIWALCELIDDDEMCGQMKNIALEAQLGEAHAVVIDFSGNTPPQCTLVKPVVT